MIKNAIVIGASRGIGESISRKLAENGFHVTLISRSEDDLKRVSEQIKFSGGSADYLVGDISKIESMKTVFQTYQASGRKIDVLVNNSGIYRENSDTYDEDNINSQVVSQIINTNMLGYWWSTIFARPLINHSGSIINISSVNGIIGKGGSDIYDMTKAAVNNLTKNQARQLAEREIRVNAVCPSSTITPMRDDALQRYLTTDKTRPEFDDLEANSIPFKRLGLPEEIAETVLFLASEKSRYMTGQIISVDGGYLLKPTFF